MSADTNRKLRVKVGLWLATAVLIALITATPALSTLFAAPGSVNAKAILNSAVKTKKIANNAVTSAKIKNGSIVDADIAAGAAISAAKINRSGLNADLLDGKNSADFVGTAGNQTINGSLAVNDITYNSIKTGYLTIPPAGMTPNSAGPNVGIFTGVAYATSVETGFVQAGVYLPDGAVITELRAAVLDNHSGTINVELWRAPASGDTVLLPPATLASVQSTGPSASWVTLTDNSIAGATVDNANYTYYVLAGFYGNGGASLELGPIRITYQYQSAGG